ncbi:DUF2339 domain-containing protein [Alloacidobacterium dinghuense]|uniref:DUF2339 domain-containing protein n=1 Tax=Alloacidobacterium dinghuense TaxID=2763107 RepID=A0A7G8BIZ4_9BACT|nr:DUF2339 domain-containing protein [Alloacidobacterium dinghuense]QNI32514.1 DUF2339 domain-containing protein [Alloacidobacterium dinghuense]
MSNNFEDLQKQVAELTARVWRLEQAAQANAAPQPRNIPAPPPEAVVATPRPAAKVQARSLETRIGSQLFNRIGIIALLIGMAWFLKFAIDNQWIGPAARVLIGMIAGVGIIAWSERFRSQGYRAFSYSLKALGTGILYLSLWAAYAVFHLVPGTVALLAMVLVTASNAILCWMQNSEVLAFYAAIGGFITPLLLSNGQNHALELFSYLLLLDIAAIIMIALRPWARLLLAAFIGTSFYAIAWYISYYSDRQFALAAFFLVAFFLLFAIAPQLLRNLRLATQTRHLTVQDNVVLIVLPLLNAALAFFEFYALLSEPGRTHARPWIALPLAAFYLIMLRISRLHQLSGTPMALPAVYLAISVIFFTAAIPLELNGLYIAIGWLLEGAALIWMARQQNHRELRFLAVSVLALAFVGVNVIHLGGGQPVLFNGRFATYLVAIVVFAFSAWIALHSPQEWKPIAIGAGIAASVLAMIAVCLEIHSFWVVQTAVHRGDLYIYEQFTYSAWAMVFGAALLGVGFWKKSAFLRWQALALLTLSIAKVFLVDTRQLSQGYRILSFLGLGILLLAVSFAYQRDWLSLRANKP